MTKPGIPSLLVVDDNDIDRQCLERALSKNPNLGPVTTAENGRDALDYLLNEQKCNGLTTCIVLLDLNMPRLDGFEFLAELQKQKLRKHTVVFVLTTSEDDSDVIHSYEHFVAGYLVKSRTGKNFEAVVDFLEHYLRVNSLPC